MKHKYTPPTNPANTPNSSQDKPSGKQTVLAIRTTTKKKMDDCGGKDAIIQQLSKLFDKSLAEELFEADKYLY